MRSLTAGLLVLSPFLQANAARACDPQSEVLLKAAGLMSYGRVALGLNLRGRMLKG
jgi:hypothetical protein